MPEIPLFPLNTVLFPGMQVKLHIFEERYKLMVNRCIEADMPFGIVLISSGHEALGPVAAPHEVGCSARIIEVQRLPLERMNIVAVGRQRFRIRSLDRGNPYLLGNVSYFSPLDDNPNLMRRFSRALRPLLVRYLDALASAEEIQFDANEIPHTPKSLAQVASILLQADNAQKQELLSLDKMSALLRRLLEIYQLEAELMTIRLSPPGDDFNIGLFSSN